MSRNLHQESRDASFIKKKDSVEILFSILNGSNGRVNINSIYEHDNYITEINDSVSELTSGLTTQTYPISRSVSGYYYYMIVAVNDVGNRTSNCYRAKIQIPPGPLDLSSDANDPEIDGSFTLNWNVSRGAENYSIYRSNSSHIFWWHGCI